MFQGFSPRTVDFMWAIRFHNEKSWFEAHKEDYIRDLQTPMRALAEDTCAAFAGRHRDLGLNLHISRIYRDARRLHGNGPYKDHLWFSLRRKAEDWTTTPVFYFELRPEGYGYGLGYYSAKPVTMAKFRARLDARPKPFARLVRALENGPGFALDAPAYRRPKGDPGSLLYPWYNSKGLSLSRDLPLDEQLYLPSLPDTLARGYEFLLPFYRYFLSLDADPEPGT